MLKPLSTFKGLLTMQLFRPQDFESLEKYKRVQVLNAISGPRQVSMIGSVNASGVTNLGLFNSVTHIGANPPYLGLIMRPTTVQRHTYDNIKTTGQYTINHVNMDILDKAHQTSAKYPSDISEFDACQLTEEYIPDFVAPFVKESKVKIGLTFKEEYPIRCNDTIMVIGKVDYILLPKHIDYNTDIIDYSQLDTTVVAGLEDYYKLVFEKSKGFARPS